MSGCGAVGSALPWGGRGRGFKSRHSDQQTSDAKVSEVFYIFKKEHSDLFNNCDRYSECSHHSD